MQDLDKDFSGGLYGWTKPGGDLRNGWMRTPKLVCPLPGSTRGMGEELWTRWRTDPHYTKSRETLAALGYHMEGHRLEPSKDLSTQGKLLHLTHIPPRDFWMVAPRCTSPLLDCTWEEGGS